MFVQVFFELVTVYSRDVSDTKGGSILMFSSLKYKETIVKGHICSQRHS